MACTNDVREGDLVMAVGNQTPPSIATDYAALAFVVEQKISQVSTTTLARVIDCTNEGGIVPTGTLTVQLLVNMLAGDGQAIKHAPIYKVPYKRIQGGANAVIIDPQPGDIGVIGFCERDIGAVKTARDVANPGSARKYSKSDGVWLATVWAAQAPSQYIVFTGGGISVVSPTAVTIQAPTITLDGNVEATGDVHTPGTITGDTDVVAGTISGANHTHGGVTAGGANTAVPNP
jgi:hypothetical protein